MVFMAIYLNSQDLLHDDHDVVHFYGLHGTKVAERQRQMLAHTIIRKTSNVFLLESHMSELTRCSSSHWL